MNKLTPEFCSYNFIDLRNNTEASIVLDSYWYSDNVSLLYDHRSDKKLYTCGADNDSTTVTIIIDLGDDVAVDSIKLLNTNMKTGTIEFMQDSESTYTTIANISNNSNSSYHWYASDYDEAYGDMIEYLTTSDGEYILTSGGGTILVTYFNIIRYIKITMTATQLVNQEKYLGELYIGRRCFKISTGKLVYYKESKTDKSGQNITNFSGYTQKIVINPTYNAEMTFRYLDQDMFNFIKQYIIQGGMYEFFPTAGEYGNTIDPTLSIDDIYLVTTVGEFNRYAYGREALNEISLNITETRLLI